MMVFPTLRSGTLKILYEPIPNVQCVYESNSMFHNRKSLKVWYFIVIRNEGQNVLWNHESSTNLVLFE